MEQFKTRYPLTYPAIKDGIESFVTNEMLTYNKNANYNSIPYGVNEKVCGEYSKFTTKMGELYGGQTLSYCTIERWYKFFKDYYNLIYYNTCNHPFSSATEYYITKNKTVGPDYYEYGQMDENFETIGGDGFYQWLSTNYFVSLDLRSEYFIAKEELSDKNVITKTYPEWMEIVSYYEEPIIYYPDAYDLFGEMSNLYGKYGANPNPFNVEDCCECNEYLAKGGSDMYYILQNWLSKVVDRIGKINESVEYYKADLEPSATVQIQLKKKVEDFGNFTSFCKEYVLGKQYNIGNICEYEGNVYILESGVGYIAKDGYYQFDKTGWRDYYSYYKMLHPDEFIEYPSSYTMSGRTVSSLDLFLRSVDTVDSVGNVLPGYYAPDKYSTFVQPPEDTTLDIMYEIGKASNITRLEDNLFSGDVLLYIETYYLNSKGNKIPSTIMKIEEGDDVLRKIDQSTANVISEEDYIDILHADFVYYKGTTFSYRNGKVNLSQYTVDGNPHRIGIKCVDHCTMSIDVIPYNITSTEGYPVRYYRIEKDIEQKYSDEYDKTINVAMCDWFIEPRVYDSNNNIVSPALRKEELLGFSLPESIENNIYVDRGYATVLDRHLRLGEVSSIEALAHYGNGSFKLNNLEEESV